jgi:hypothetical protein
MALLDTIKAKAISIAVNQAFDMLYDDFDGNLPKVESMINKFAGSGDNINAAQLRLFNMVMGFMKDPDNNWRRLVQNVIDNVDKEVARTFVQNFFVNSVTLGGYRQREINQKEGCNCPWAILMDPTTACNLHCNGCWAANYTDSKQKSSRSMSLTPSSRRAWSSAPTSTSSRAASRHCARRTLSASARSTLTATSAPSRTARSSTRSSRTRSCA